MERKRKGSYSVGVPGGVEPGAAAAAIAPFNAEKDLDRAAGKDAFLDSPGTSLVSWVVNDDVPRRC
jgi:hypothetical protein